MRNYELTVVLPGAYTDTKQKKLIEGIEGMVKGLGGEVDNTLEWGKREFFYPIKKQESGYYCYFELSLPSDKASSLSTGFERNEEVLRHLLIQVEKRMEVKGRSERVKEDRGGGRSKEEVGVKKERIVRKKTRPKGGEKKRERKVKGKKR